MKEVELVVEEEKSSSTLEPFLFALLDLDPGFLNLVVVGETAGL